jgi:hypothetical protein
MSGTTRLREAPSPNTSPALRDSHGSAPGVQPDPGWDNVLDALREDFMITGHRRELIRYVRASLPTLEGTDWGVMELLVLAAEGQLRPYNRKASDELRKANSAARVEANQAAARTKDPRASRWKASPSDLDIDGTNANRRHRMGMRALKRAERTNMPNSAKADPRLRRLWRAFAITGHKRNLLDFVKAGGLPALPEDQWMVTALVAAAEGKLKPTNRKSAQLLADIVFALCVRGARADAIMAWVANGKRGLKPTRWRNMSTDGAHRQSLDRRYQRGRSALKRFLGA